MKRERAYSSALAGGAGFRGNRGGGGGLLSLRGLAMRAPNRSRLLITSPSCGGS